LARDVTLAHAQLRLLQSGQALTVAIDLIRQKIEGCLETLAGGPPGLLNPSAERVLRDTVKGLAADSPDTPEALRWREAQAAKAYFTAWRAIPLQWKGTGRHPIPPAWRQMGPRLSSITGTARQATHPANALLNYAYGVLESQVRRAIVTAGLDPTLGVLHASHPGRSALVYDLMEPLRPQVDRLVLTFLTEHVFHPKDFIRQPDGACRLHPQLARVAAQLGVSQDMVQSVVDHNLGIVCGGRLTQPNLAGRCRQEHDIRLNTCRPLRSAIIVYLTTWGALSAVEALRTIYPRTGS